MRRGLVFFVTALVSLGACGATDPGGGERDDPSPAERGADLDDDTEDTGHVDDCEDWPPTGPEAPTEPSARGVIGSWWVASRSYPGDPITYAFPVTSDGVLYRIQTLIVRETGADHWRYQDSCSDGEVWSTGFPVSWTWTELEPGAFRLTPVDQPEESWTCTIEAGAPHAMGCVYVSTGTPSARLSRM